MNRTSELFDDRIADWLETDPTEAPGQILDTIVAALPSIPQRRMRRPLAGLSAWQGPQLAPLGAILVLAALVLVALVVGVIGRTPAPTPSPESTPRLLVFESPLYGYSIGYMDGWRVSPATERIQGINPPWVDTNVADQFNGLPGGPRPNAIVVAAMAEVTEGTTLDSWTGQTAGAVCGVPTEPQEGIEVAGQPATLSTFARCNGYFHIWVTFVRGTQAFHVVWLDFSGAEAADRRLFDDILASFVLPEATPTPTAEPSAAGAPIPGELIGAWHHPAPGWWWFLPAGDPECVQVVRTDLDCVVWQRGTTPREIGIAWIDGANLKVNWRSGFCTSLTSTYSLAPQGDALTLVDIGGGCEGGTFALTRASTGSAPSAPPPPAP